MIKALVTAGSSGVGRELVDHFAPHASSLSRKNGYDICDPVTRARIAELSLECDIFVNHAYARDQSQTELLSALYSAWRNERKVGYIFSTGTYGTYNQNGIDPDYIAVKAGLDRAHSEFCQQIKSEGLPFRMTLIRPGMLDTEKSRAKPHWRGNGVRGKPLAEILEFLYHLPPDVLVENLVVESIVYGE